MSGISKKKNETIWTQKVRNVLNPTSRSVRLRTLAGEKWKSVLNTRVVNRGVFAQFYVTWNVKPKRSIFFIGETELIFKNHKNPEASITVTRGFFRSSDNENFRYFDNSYIGDMSEENGFLDSDGCLEVEFHVIVLRWYNELSIAHFNFGDPFYDRKYFKFIFGNDMVDELNVPDQMLVFHSPVISSMIHTGVRLIGIVPKKKIKYYKLMLQMIHGVHENLKDFQIRQLLAIAHRFKMYSVTRKCEFRLIRMTRKENDMESIQWFLNISIWYNLYRLMSSVLRSVDTAEELKEYMKEMDVDMMSGAIMKTLAMKIFDLC